MSKSQSEGESSRKSSQSEVIVKDLWPAMLLYKT